MMDKVYYDDADINADSSVIYAKGRGYRYAYKDAGLSIKYPSDELFDAYLNGAMIFIDNPSGYDEYIIPTGFKWIGNIGYISYSVRYDSTGSQTFIGFFEGTPAPTT